MRETRTSSDTRRAPEGVQTVGIIGAGFAGLACAKILREFGYDVLIYDKTPDVGGVWSRIRRYPGLSTQNNKGSYCLSDYPYPKSYPEWPSGAQVQQYMASYTHDKGLEPYLRLNREVTSTSLDEAAGTWTVNTRDSETGEDAIDTFDYLVVANGIFSEPFVPAYRGQEEFETAGGRLLATSDWHGMDEVKDKDVLVVGYGKSACDAAAAAADAARSTTVVARHLIWKMPKKVKGVLNFKFLMLTRMGENLFPYRRLKGTARFLHGAGKPVPKSMLGSLQGVSIKQLKLDRHGLVPDGGFDRIARSTVSLTSDGFFEKVDAGRLSVKRDTVITRLGAENGKPVAELSTGETVPADVVLCGTGFRQEVPFLPADLQARVHDDRGNFELYRQVQPLEVNRLSFCGYNSSFFSPLSAEVAALWIATWLGGGVQLPPLEKARADIAEKLAWMEERTEGKHAKGTNIIPFSMYNIDETLDELDANLPATKRATQWLAVINPLDYRGMTEKLRRRWGKASSRV